MIRGVERNNQEERRDVIRVLHFVQDDKFIDNTREKFEEDGRFFNRYCMIVKASDFKFARVKNTQGIKLLYSIKVIKEVLDSDTYDVILFYSLPDFHVFKYIPDNKIVIWWAWGYDIYGRNRFIDIPLYKPLTRRLYQDLHKAGFLQRVFSKIGRIPFLIDAIRNIKQGSKKKAIKRVDFFQPVIHIEYELMKKCKGFKAKEFYHPWRGIISSISPIFPEHNDNILIGHSAAFINNHLDVWERVKKYVPESSTVIFPINYGDLDYANYLANYLKASDANIKLLRDFLPVDEYYALVGACSYAILGLLREAGIGNMFKCLSTGVKLFLYKESIPYQYFHDLGFKVFAIEDIDENSFLTPLSLEDMQHNKQCVIKEFEMSNTIREQAIADIQKRLGIIKK